MPSTIKKTSTFILGFFSPNTRDNILGVKRFNFQKRKYPEKQMIIFFVDGKGFHGGLCDRFKGIISLFHYCICENITFKINYIYPFNLSDYLLINEYDWILANREISFNFFESKYMYLIGDTGMRRLLKLKTKRQIHAYANCDIVSELNEIYKTNYLWGDLFRKLFKPTEKLRNKINECQHQIGGRYVGVQFRFQNLLGDSVEYKGITLSDEEKNKLISKCRKCLLGIQEKSNIKRILVTADSNFFLKEILGLNSIYVFLEKVIHIDTTSVKDDYEAFMKTFLDFYLLSEGEKVYSVSTHQMYKSDFPLYAAKLNDIPFERVLID